MFNSQFLNRIVILVAVSTGAVAAAEQHLSDFRHVVTSEKPGSVEQAAARELAEYVGRIVDHPLDVLPLSKWAADDKGLCFFVGTEAAERAAGERFAPWKVEESLLRTIPHGLALAGDDGAGDAWSPRTHAGSMLAVYTLLDAYLGVHWFWPGPFGEHVPHHPDAMLPSLSLRSTPAFE